MTKQQNFIPSELAETAKQYGLPVGRIFTFEFLHESPASSSIWIKYLHEEKLVPKMLFPFALAVSEIREERAEAIREHNREIARVCLNILNF